MTRRVAWKRILDFTNSPRVQNESFVAVFLSLWKIIWKGSVWTEGPFQYSRTTSSKPGRHVQKFLNLKDLGICGPLSSARRSVQWSERAEDRACSTCVSQWMSQLALKNGIEFAQGWSCSLIAPSEAPILEMDFFKLMLTFLLFLSLPRKI